MRTIKDFEGASKVKCITGTWNDNFTLGKIYPLHRIESASFTTTTDDGTEGFLVNLIDKFEPIFESNFAVPDISDSKLKFHTTPNGTPWSESAHDVKDVDFEGSIGFQGHVVIHPITKDNLKEVLIHNGFLPEQSHADVYRNIRVMEVFFNLSSDSYYKFRYLYEDIYTKDFDEFLAFIQKRITLKPLPLGGYWELDTGEKIFAADVILTSTRYKLLPVLLKPNIGRIGYELPVYLPKQYKGKECNFTVLDWNNSVIKAIWHE
jgi:hypothetical protein